MKEPVRSPSTETRERILDTAEEHFRRVGFAKTAVADIAEHLGMSPANIYRFFASKGAINDAICRRIMAEIDARASAILTGPGTAAERLERFALEIHRYNKSRLTEERRIHDMVEVAMRESWEAIDNHCQAQVGFLVRFLSEAIASGEFAPVDDVVDTARALFASFISLFHPVLIAKHGTEDQTEDVLRLVRFALRALQPPTAPPLAAALTPAVPGDVA